MQAQLAEPQPKIKAPEPDEPERTVRFSAGSERDSLIACKRWITKRLRFKRKREIKPPKTFSAAAHQFARRVAIRDSTWSVVMPVCSVIGTTEATRKAAIDSLKQNGVCVVPGWVDEFVVMLNFVKAQRYPEWDDAMLRSMAVCQLVQIKCCGAVLI